MSCPQHTDAGAYLLGALPPAERAGFQAHLNDCADCRRAVGELADLPGLLARVPESTVTGPGPAPTPPPPTILAGLLSEVRRRRANRMVLATVAAVVTALAVVGVGVLALGSSDDDGDGPPPPVAAADGPTRTVPMQLTPEAAGYDIEASLDVTPTSWGTEIRVHCRYTGNYAAPVYVLYGLAELTDHELARWTAPSGQEVDLSAASDVRAFDSFEIRSDYGKTVMRGGP